MSVTVKPLKQAGTIKEDAAGTFKAPTFRVPFTNFSMIQKFGIIENPAIVGVSFPGLPLLGVSACTGSLEEDFDVISVMPLLELAFGDQNTKVFTCPATKNEITNSFILVDGVKTNKYAGVVCPKFTLSSEADNALKISMDLLGWKAEVRDDTGIGSIGTEQGLRLLHQHLSGTGYFRIGDQSNALESGDNIDIEQVSWGINWNYAAQNYNNTIPLQHLSGSGGRPSNDFSFRVARYETDNYMSWRDNGTVLQAEAYYYLSAAANLKIQVTNFIIAECSPSDDEIAKVDVTCRLARNGIGTSYENTNMQYVTPIRIVVDNA